jgi:hypothetical protein
VILVLLGCATSMDLGRAVTLDPGRTEGTAGLAISGLGIGVGGPETGGWVPWIQATGGLHHGVTSRVELGVRGSASGIPGAFTTLGAAVDTKVQVHRGVDGAPSVAFVGSAVYYRPSEGGAPWHVLGPQATLLVGYPVREAEVTFSPRVAGWYETSYGQVPLLTGSVGIGVAWAAPVGSHIDLVPELVCSWSPIGFDGSRDDPDRNGAVGVELGVGVRFGRR